MSLNKVSCIIPCYNSAPFIGEAIQSILDQTWQDIEIIAVDDGSTDNTVDILAGYSPRVRVLRHKGGRNCGKSASLNLGIRESIGDAITFMDHDDIWLPTKTEKQLQILNSSRDCALVFANGYWIDAKGKVGDTILPGGFSVTDGPAGLLLDCYIKSSTAVMVRREVLNEIGLFDEKLIGCDDHDMWLRIMEHHQIEYLDEPLYKYRMHPNQLSTDIKMWLGGFAVLDKACKRSGYGFGTRRRRLAVLYYRLAQYERARGHYLRAMKDYMLAGVSDPARAIAVILGNGANAQRHG